MKGKDTIQKMMKHIKSLVLVPEDNGMVFASSYKISDYEEPAHHYTHGCY
jgi:hypothetical protein